MFQLREPHIPIAHFQNDYGSIPVIHTNMRSFRPSLLDPRFTGDPWIVEDDEGMAALCLDGYQITRIQLVALDLPSLNRVFSQLRQSRRRTQSD